MLYKWEVNFLAVYITMFILSTILLMVSERKEGLGAKVFVMLALLLPIGIAGLRKVGIGTDTEVYVNVLYDAAKNSTSFFDYLSKQVYSSFQYKSVMSWEFGYNILLYFTTKLTGSIQGVFFVTQLIVVYFIYKGIKEYSKGYSIAMAMLVFYFMFYGGTLNAMRQWIAIAIIFWGTHFLNNKQDKYFFITVIVALLFHNSAVLGFVIWAVYRFMDSEKQRRRLAFKGVVLSDDRYKIVTIILIGIFCLICLNVIGTLLSSINAVFARYVRVYITGTVRIMPMQLLRRLPIIFPLVINWKKIKKRYAKLGFVTSMLVLDTIISQLGGITAQSSRIGYFFSVFETILIAELISVKRRNIRIIYYLFFVVFLFAGFYYDNVLMGRSEIVPYLFFFD